MGCDNQRTFPHAAAMFDDFFAKGGNTFDTAYIYAGGVIERVLGQWIKTRNVREQVVVMTKGAHTPFCTPQDLSRQLLESLDRQQTDYADLYLMHRDNPQIPVGEFVDVLNEHKSAGRIKAFGGSNWSIARGQEANEYAKKNGKTGFAAVSNNFSLARMVGAPWAGCISASDVESRGWFSKTQMPLFAWSSQARGFFLPGRAAPEKKDDAELVRCWYSDDNFKRLERVNEMASKRSVLPINIALAYVLNQPFPTFALIGPRQLSETRTSFAALDIELSPQELRWLNLED
jgi:aryl-alcohol dehydrogenase-like predicted oxidoreductase